MNWPLDQQTLEILLSPWVLGLLGLCVGSFLNVVIHRMPLMLERAWRLDSAELLGVEVDAPTEISLSKPRSRCPSCSHLIAWYENIPVLSFLRLRARCAACHAPISWRYPAVECLTGALFAAAAWHAGPVPAALLWCGFLAALVALAFIDLDTQLLPDNLTLPLLWAGLTFAALGWTEVSLSKAVWGAIAGYLALWLVHHTYRIVRGREGMGYGDFKLLSALGAWMGWQMLPAIVLLASVVGAVVGLSLMFFKNHDRDTPIPFGPYLAGGGIAALFFGPQLLRWWFPLV
jgi:leader peptidase (prepilin peptidase) / N-methyltransferase